MSASLQRFDIDIAQFLEWFKSSGGTLHENVDISHFEEAGRGAIASGDVAVRPFCLLGVGRILLSLRASKEGTVLLTIPRSILLSTRTSALPPLLSKEDWTSLGKGWTGLILCMMYEEARGAASPWCTYLRDLPTDFDTLIYWSEEELGMLQASTIRSKFTVP
jgi:N-lysine methyltransferase SETD6